MARHSEGQRWAAGRVARIEAKRRAMAVSKVGLVIVVAMLATLIISGHRAAPGCGGPNACIIERGPN